MALSLGRIADIVGAKLQGDANLQVKNIASLASAKEGDISFATGRKYLPQLLKCKASAVILTNDMADSYQGNKLISQSPYLAYAKTVSALHPPPPLEAHIHPSSTIDDTAEISDTVVIAANVVIGKHVKIAQGVIIEAGCVIGDNTSIGKNTMLHANVTLYSNTKISHHCRLHSGVVIGADGFGYAPNQGEWYKIQQIGNVILGDNVEIGANTTIDRAALGSTIIESGVKLDNQIQVGHNVIIGEHTAIAASVAIAGSTHIGKRCQIGGASAIAGHLNIADDVIITGMSMVIRSIEKAGTYSSGMPVKDNRTWRKNIIRFSQLDKMAQKIRAIEKALKNIS